MSDPIFKTELQASGQRLIITIRPASKPSRIEIRVMQTIAGDSGESANAEKLLWASRDFDPLSTRCRDEMRRKLKLSTGDDHLLVRLIDQYEQWVLAQRSRKNPFKIRVRGHASRPITRRKNLRAKMRRK